MKKNFLFGIFLMLFLLFAENVSAKDYTQVCFYDKEVGNETVSLHFFITSGESGTRLTSYEYHLSGIIPTDYNETEEHEIFARGGFTKSSVPSDFEEYFIKQYIKNDHSCPEQIYSYILRSANNNPYLYLSVTKNSSDNVERYIGEIPLVSFKFIEARTCLDLPTKSSCLSSKALGFTCVWVEDASAPTSVFEDTGYCNVDFLKYVACGNSHDIPLEIPRIFSTVVTILKIATPLVLVLVAIITLIRALVASKEDEIKKAKASLVKKIIAAAIIFFVVSIVQFVIFMVADDSEKNSLSSCLNCFLNNSCSGAYYKTNVLGVNYCNYISSGVDSEYIKCESFYQNKLY